jgi:hypothetical protein
MLTLIRHYLTHIDESPRVAGTARGRRTQSSLPVRSPRLKYCVAIRKTAQVMLSVSEASQIPRAVMGLRFFACGSE